MAYLEIKRGDKLVKRQAVDDALAEKGYSVRLNGEQVSIKLGETKQAGPYSLTLTPGSVSTDNSPPSPAVLVSETDVAGDGQGPGDVDPDTQKPNIPGYEVTGRLGSGGMGSVWLATQLSTNRKVAIKLMSQSFFGSEKAQNRFAREVQLTARLDHPNIAKVYDSGLNEGNYFYVLEYIEGHHLDLFVEANKLKQAQVLGLMGRVCKAVYHAHLKGIIHRDLKPSNILVTEDGEPHVLDLGLAKSFLNDDSDVQVSIDGEISGTPAYMSPEQARGDLKQIDMRTDVYSLGIILFRLVTGKPPHDLSGSRLDVLHRIAKEEVKRPRQIKKDLNSELESLLLKALSHDPNTRYLSAGDMADDIKNYLTGEPLSVKSATTIYFLQKKIRKHLKKVCILAAVILVLLGIGLFAFSQVISSRVKVRTAQEELEIQRRSAELAQAEAGSVNDKWQDLEVMVLEGRKETDVRAAVRALHQEYESLQQELTVAQIPEVSVPHKTISIDGDMSDWIGVPVAIRDRANDSGGIPYIDIIRGYIASDDEFFYFRVDLNENLEASDIERQFGLEFSVDHETTVGMTFWEGMNEGRVQIRSHDEDIILYPNGFGFYACDANSVEFKVRKEYVYIDVNGVPLRLSSYDSQSGAEDYSAELLIDAPDFSPRTDPFTWRAPVSTAIAQKTIKIDGNLEDWNDVPVAIEDRVDEIYGIPYIDIARGFIASDDDFMYFRIDLNGDVETGDTSRRFSLGFEFGPGAGIGMNFGQGPDQGQLEIGFQREGVMSYSHALGFYAWHGNSVEFKVHKKYVYFDLHHAELSLSSSSHQFNANDNTTQVLIDAPDFSPLPDPFTWKAPESIRIPHKTILIDGNLDDWNDVPVAIEDRSNDVYAIPFVDILRAYVAVDRDHIYFRIDVNDNVKRNEDASSFNLEFRIGNDSGIGISFGGDTGEGQVGIGYQGEDVMTYSHKFGFYAWHGNSVEFRVSRDFIYFDLHNASISLKSRAYVFQVGDQTAELLIDAPEFSPSPDPFTWQAPDHITIPHKTIRIDGNLDDWNDVPVAIEDRPNDIYGIPYIDLVRGYIAGDDDYLYFRIDVNDDVESSDALGPFSLGFRMNDGAGTGIDFWGDLNEGQIKIDYKGEEVMIYDSDYGYYAWSGSSLEFKVARKHVYFEMHNSRMSLRSFEHEDRVGDESLELLIDAEDFSSRTEPIMQNTSEETE